MYCMFQHKSEDSSEEPHLPPIAEDQAVLPTWAQMQKCSQTRTEELQFQQNLLHPLQLLGNDNGNCHSQTKLMIPTVCVAVEPLKGTVKLHTLNERVSKSFGHMSNFLILKSHQDCLAELQEEKDWASRVLGPFYIIDLMETIHLRRTMLTEV